MSNAVPEMQSSGDIKHFNSPQKTLFAVGELLDVTSIELVVVASAGVIKFCMSRGSLPSVCHEPSTSPYYFAVGTEGEEGRDRGDKGGGSWRKERGQRNAE